jgi:hypothetical protein
MHQDLATWTGHLIAGRFLITTLVQIIIAARPMRAMDLVSIFLVNKTAWAAEYATLSLFSATLFEVSVVTVGVITHGFGCIRPWREVLRANVAATITILCTTVVDISSCASEVCA